MPRSIWKTKPTWLEVKLTGKTGFTPFHTGLEDKEGHPVTGESPEINSYLNP